MKSILIATRIICRRGKNKILVMREAKDKYSLPGGKVDPSDRTYKDGAIRELGEETGLIPKSRDSVKYIYTSIHPRHASYFFNVEYQNVEGELLKEHKEGTPMWIDIDLLTDPVKNKSKYVGDYEILHDMGVI